MEKKYVDIYLETIDELKKLFRERLSRNTTLSQRERDARTRELWRNLAVPHKDTPRMKGYKMIHFGGRKDGQPIKTDGIWG